MTNAAAFMAWVGSLLDMNSGRSQYVYLYGEGGTGKGRIAAFLKRLFGDAYGSPDPTHRNQFWTAQLVGKRLICFADLDSSKFLNSGSFKTLTGEDAICVEPKGQPAYTTSLQCKFLILSNNKPSLKDDAANRRRAIYCEMLPLAPDTKLVTTSRFDALLWEEAAWWLCKCKALWAKRNDAGFVESDNIDALQDAMDDHQVDHMDIFDKWFDRVSDAHVTPGTMRIIMEKEDLRGERRADFEAFMFKRHGIKKERHRVGGALGPRLYQGIRVKLVMDSEELRKY